MSARLALLVAGILFFTACKKDADDILPQGSINSPSTGKTYYLPDTVYVNASVSDNNVLRFVKLAVTKGDGVPISSVYQQNEFSGTQADINAALVVDDVHITSGNYFIQLTVGDGINTREVFRQIQLIETPLALTGTLFVRNIGQETAIDSLSNGDLLSATTVGGNVSKLLAGSYFQEIVLASTFSSGIRFLNSSGFYEWGVLPIQAGQVQYPVMDMWFSSVDLRYYVALSDGTVRALGKKGQQLLTLNIGSGFVPDMVRVFDTSVFVFARNQAAGMKVLFVFNRTSGVLLQSAQLDFEVNDIFPLSNGSMLLLVTVGNQWTVKQMNASDLSVTDAGVGQTSGSIKSVVKRTDDSYAILTDEGLYLAGPGFSQISLVSGTQSVLQVRENQVSGSLYISTASTWSQVDGNGNLVNPIALPQGVVDFDFLYNK